MDSCVIQINNPCLESWLNISFSPEIGASLQSLIAHFYIALSGPTIQGLSGRSVPFSRQGFEMDGMSSSESGALSYHGNTSMLGYHRKSVTKARLCSTLSVNE